MPVQCGKKCQAPEVPPSKSSRIDASPAKYKSTTDDGSGPPNLSFVFAVCDDLEAVWINGAFDDEDRIMIAESSRTHANLLMIFSALPSALIASQLLQSCWPIRPLALGSWLDLLARVVRFLGNAYTGEPAAPRRYRPSYGSGGPTEISPLPLPTLTRLLWLMSFLVSIGCVVVTSSLKASACRDLREVRLWRCPRWRRGEFADSGEAGLLVDVTRTFHTIHVCQLTSFLLFLWGLAIPLLHHPLSLLAIVGSGGTFFLGQCLLVSTLPPWRVELTVHPCHGEKAVSLP